MGNNQYPQKEKEMMRYAVSQPPQSNIQISIGNNNANYLKVPGNYSSYNNNSAPQMNNLNTSKLLKVYDIMKSQRLPNIEEQFSREEWAVIQNTENSNNRNSNNNQNFSYQRNF